jgi:hypothetical protein
MQCDLSNTKQKTYRIWLYKENFESSCLIRPVCHNSVVYVKEESVRTCQKLLKNPWPKYLFVRLVLNQWHTSRSIVHYTSNCWWHHSISGNKINQRRTYTTARPRQTVKLGNKYLIQEEAWSKKRTLRIASLNCNIIWFIAFKNYCLFSVGKKILNPAV